MGHYWCSLCKWLGTGTQLINARFQGYLCPQCLNDDLAFVRLTPPEEVQEALTTLEWAEGRLLRGQVDYPYSDVDLDSAAEDVTDAQTYYAAQCWG
jgi:hypothetical protein